MLGHGLDVAAARCALLGLLVGESAGRELHGRAPAAGDVARNGADVVEACGDVLHVLDVRGDVDDVLLHARNLDDLGRDLGIGYHLIFDRGNGLVGFQVLGNSRRPDVVERTCHCHGLVLDGRHRLDGLDVLPHRLDRLDVVGHGLDLVLERDDDGGGFGVGLRLLLGLLRLFGGLLGGISELSGVVLGGHQLLDQLFRRTIRRRRDRQGATKALYELLDLHNHPVHCLIDDLRREPRVVRQLHVLRVGNGRPNDKDAPLDNRRRQDNRATRRSSLVRIHLDGIILPIHKRRRLCFRIISRGNIHVSLFKDEKAERQSRLSL